MTDAVTPSGPLEDPNGAPYPNDELTRICGEVAAVFRRAWGRGPVRTTANWAGPDVLIVLLAPVAE